MLARSPIANSVLVGLIAKRVIPAHNFFALTNYYYYSYHLPKNMWSALDWTGMLTTASAAPDDERNVLDESQKSDGNKLKGDTDSETGGETDTAGGLKDDSELDTDSDEEGVTAKKGFGYKRALLLLVAAVFAFAIFGGAFGGKKAEEGDETQSNLEEYGGKSISGERTLIEIYHCSEYFSLFPDRSSNFTCSSNSTQDYETAFVSLSLDGMTRTATDVELREVEDAVFAVYNNVSAGCDDIYERFMENATIVNQTLVEDSKGAKHLTMDLTTQVVCDGCGVEIEILFGDGEKGAEETAGEGRKLKEKSLRGVRGSRSLKGAKSPNSQEFIDELDKTLQLARLPVKQVKEGIVYKRKDGKKGEGKLKLVPSKEHESKKGDKKEDKEDPKSDLKEDHGTRRRRMY